LCAPLSQALRFDMTVFDSRFLHGARRHTVLPITGTDIECWLFECHDSTCAATYQPRKTAAWLDERRLTLQLDSSCHQVCNKQGHTLWPPALPGKGTPRPDGKGTFTRSFAMLDFTTVGTWIRCHGTSFERFEVVVAAATVAAAGRL
jgi:hypothetical protein